VHAAMAKAVSGIELPLNGELRPRKEGTDGDTRSTDASRHHSRVRWWERATVGICSWTIGCVGKPSQRTCAAGDVAGRPALRLPR